MLDAVVRLPVSLEGVDADGPVLCHVWVKDLGQEEPCIHVRSDQIKYNQTRCLSMKDTG